VNWLRTIWRGSLRLEVPMLFSLGVVFVFGLGGLTGLYLADIPQDLYLHDTYFVVGHFHLTMAAAVFLGSFASIYYWFPKIWGRMFNSTLGKLHFWFSFVPINVVFCTMLLVGYSGMQRRLYNLESYEFAKRLLPMNQFISYMAFTLFTGQVFFVSNFLYSVFRGKRASNNPWQVGTLEWQIPSPPPHHNFDVIPKVIHGPHEFNNPLVKGKDWLAQDEEIPVQEAEASREALLAGE